MCNYRALRFDVASLAATSPSELKAALSHFEAFLVTAADDILSGDPQYATVQDLLDRLYDSDAHPATQETFSYTDSLLDDFWTCNWQPAINFASFIQGVFKALYAAAVVTAKMSEGPLLAELCNEGFWLKERGQRHMGPNYMRRVVGILQAHLHLLMTPMVGLMKRGMAIESRPCSFFDGEATEASGGSAAEEANNKESAEIRLSSRLPSEADFQFMKFIWTRRIQTALHAVISARLPTRTGEKIKLGLNSPEDRTADVNKLTIIEESWTPILDLCDQCWFWARKIEQSVIGAQTPRDAHIEEVMTNFAKECFKRVTSLTRIFQVYDLPSSDEDARSILAVSLVSMLLLRSIRDAVMRSLNVAKAFALNLAILDLWPVLCSYPWSWNVRTEGVITAIAVLKQAAAAQTSYRLPAVCAQWQRALWSKLYPIFASPLSSQPHDRLSVYKQLGACQGVTCLMHRLLKLRVVSHGGEADVDFQPFDVKGSSAHDLGPFSPHLLLTTLHTRLLKLRPVTHELSENILLVKLAAFPGLSGLCIADTLNLVKFLYSQEGVATSEEDPLQEHSQAFFSITLQLCETVSRDHVVSGSAGSDHVESGRAKYQNLCSRLLPSALATLKAVMSKDVQLSEIERRRTLDILRLAVKVTSADVSQHFHSLACFRLNVNVDHGLICGCPTTGTQQAPAVSYLLTEEPCSPQQKEYRSQLHQFILTIRDHATAVLGLMTRNLVKDLTERQLIKSTLANIIGNTEWASPGLYEQINSICKRNPWLINHVIKRAQIQFWKTHKMDATSRLADDDSHGSCRTHSITSSNYRSRGPFNRLSILSKAGSTEIVSPDQKALNSDRPVGVSGLLFVSIAGLALLSRLKRDPGGQATLLDCALDSLMRSHPHSWVRCQSALALLALQNIPSDDCESEREWLQTANVVLRVLTAVLNDPSPFMKTQFVIRFERSTYARFCDARTLDLLTVTITHARDLTAELVGVQLAVHLSTFQPISRSLVGSAPKSVHALHSMEFQLLTLSRRVMQLWEPCSSLASLQVSLPPTRGAQDAEIESMQFVLWRSLKMLIYLLGETPELECGTSYTLLGRMATLAHHSLRAQMVGETVLSGGGGFMQDVESHLTQTQNEKFSEWSDLIDSLEAGKQLSDAYQSKSRVREDRVTLVAQMLDIGHTRGLDHPAHSVATFIGLLSEVTRSSVDFLSPTHAGVTSATLVLEALCWILRKGSWNSSGGDCETLSASKRERIKSFSPTRDVTTIKRQLKIQDSEALTHIRDLFFHGVMSDIFRDLCVGISRFGADLDRHEADVVTRRHAQICGLLCAIMKTTRHVLVVLKAWDCLCPSETFGKIQAALFSFLIVSLNASNPDTHARALRASKKKAAPEASEVGSLADVCLLFPAKETTPAFSLVSEEDHLWETWREMILLLGSLGFRVPPKEENEPSPNVPAISPKRDITILDPEFPQLAKFLLEAEKEIWTIHLPLTPSNRQTFEDNSSTSADCLKSLDKMRPASNNFPLTKDIFIYRSIYILTKAIWKSRFSKDCGSLTCKSWVDSLHRTLDRLLQHSASEITRHLEHGDVLERENMGALKPMRSWFFWCQMFLLETPWIFKMMEENHKSQMIAVCKIVFYVKNLHAFSDGQNVLHTAQIILTRFEGQLSSNLATNPMLRLFLLLRRLMNQSLNALIGHLTTIEEYVTMKRDSLRNVFDTVAATDPHLLLCRGLAALLPFIGAEVVMTRLSTIFIRALRLALRLFNSDLNARGASADSYEPGIFASNKIHTDAERTTTRAALCWMEQLGVTISHFGKLVRPWSAFLIEPLLAVLTVPSIACEVQLRVIELLRRCFMAGCFDVQSVHSLVTLLRNPLVDAITLLSNPASNICQAIVKAESCRSTNIQDGQPGHPEDKLSPNFLSSDEARSTAFLFGWGELRSVVIALYPRSASFVLLNDTDRLVQEFLSSRIFHHCLRNLFASKHRELANLTKSTRPLPRVASAAPTLGVPISTMADSRLARSDQTPHVELIENHSRLLDCDPARLDDSQHPNIDSAANHHIHEPGLYRMPENGFRQAEWSKWALEWMMGFIQKSPSHSIHSFSFVTDWLRNKKSRKPSGEKMPMAQGLGNLTKLCQEIFPFAFFSVWKCLTPPDKERVMEVMTTVLTSTHTPRNIISLTTALMEFLAQQQNGECVSYGQLANICSKYSLLHHSLFFWEAEWFSIKDHAFQSRKDPVLQALVQLNSACNQIDGVAGLFRLVAETARSYEVMEGSMSVSVSYLAWGGQPIQKRSRSAANGYSRFSLKRASSQEIDVSNKNEEERQWYRQMHCWSQAVESYCAEKTARLGTLHQQMEHAAGLLRCLCELSDWQGMQKALQGEMMGLVANAIHAHDCARSSRSTDEIDRTSPVSASASLRGVSEKMTQISNPLSLNSLKSAATLLGLPHTSTETRIKIKDDQGGGASRFLWNSKEVLRLACFATLHAQDWDNFKSYVTTFVALQRSLIKDQHDNGDGKAIDDRDDESASDSGSESRAARETSQTSETTLSNLYGKHGVLAAEHCLMSILLAILNNQPQKAIAGLDQLVVQLHRKLSWVTAAAKHNSTITALAILKSQQVAELYEILAAMTEEHAPYEKNGLVSPAQQALWDRRDRYSSWKATDIPNSVLCIRAVALSPALSPKPWLKLASLCLSERKISFAMHIHKLLINSDEAEPHAAAWVQYIQGLLAGPELQTQCAERTADVTARPLRTFEANLEVFQAQGLKASFDLVSHLTSHPASEFSDIIEVKRLEQIQRLISPACIIPRRDSVEGEKLTENFRSRSLHQCAEDELLDTRAMRRMICDEETGDWKWCMATIMHEQAKWVKNLCFPKKLHVSSHPHQDMTPCHQRQTSEDCGAAQYFPGPHCIFQLFHGLTWTIHCIDSADAEAWQQLAQLNFDLVKRAPRSWISLLDQGRDSTQEIPVIDPHRPALPPTKCPTCLQSLEGKSEVHLERASEFAETNPCLVLTHEVALHCVCEAIKAFLQAIRLSHDPDSLLVFSNLLRVLNLWFQAWTYPALNKLVLDNVSSISSSVWIRVLPQLLSRHSLEHEKLLPVLQAIFSQLVDDAPAELLFPLGVSSNSSNETYSRPAKAVLAEFEDQHPILVAESVLFIQGMRQTAIKAYEAWYILFDDAARMVFDTSPPDYERSVELLDEAFKTLASGHFGNTPVRSCFISDFGLALTQARLALECWKRTRNEMVMHASWSHFHSIYAAIHRARETVQATFALSETSPELAAKLDWTLPVPGQYDTASRSGPSVFAILPTVRVLSSKQRPRFMEILGSDGIIYPFLLKGHEDLRQDQRAIQVVRFLDQMVTDQSNLIQPTRYVSPFNSITSALVVEPGSNVGTGASLPRFDAERLVGVCCPTVIPLSGTIGLVAWLSNSQTLLSLIKTYRASLEPPKSITAELQLVSQSSNSFDNLKPFAKYEIFSEVIEQTSAEDLRVMLLWQARHSPSLPNEGLSAWFSRRHTFSTSLASMSVFGYVLGLGDRHPSNLMIDQTSGSVIHIDYGDCFEVASLRHRFPEKVPFRLTRMLVEALGPAGVEGTYRLTSARHVSLMRQHKALILSILDTFLFDPLTSWNNLLPFTTELRALCRMKNTNKDILNSGDLNRAPLLNECAAVILERAKQKIEGTVSGEEITAEELVDSLIKSATDPLNLAQSYIGWCPFW